MSNSKGAAPEGAPPAYGSQPPASQHVDAGSATTATTVNSPYPPAQAHMAQPGGYPPYNETSKPGYPQAQGTLQGGYYQPGPMQYGPPQGGYYGPQQMQQAYYGPPQPVYGYAPYGRPQGQYVDQRGQTSTADAFLASMACCCCLELCLF